MMVWWRADGGDIGGGRSDNDNGSDSGGHDNKKCHY